MSQEIISLYLRALLVITSTLHKKFMEKFFNSPVYTSFILTRSGLFPDDMDNCM